MAVKRAVTLLHSHTITSRAGKGEPGEGQDRVDRGREAGELCGGLTPILRASRGRSFRWSLPLLVLISSPHPYLLFLHGLESNPGSSLQTEEEAGLP